MTTQITESQHNSKATWPLEESSVYFPLSNPPHHYARSKLDLLSKNHVSINLHWLANQPLGISHMKWQNTIQENTNDLLMVYKGKKR